MNLNFMKKRILVLNFYFIIAITSIFCQERINSSLANVVSDYILEKTNGQIYRVEQDSLWGDLKILIQLEEKYAFSSIKAIVAEAFEGIENSDIVEDWSHSDSFSRILYIYGDLADGYFISVDFIENPVLTDNDQYMEPSKTSFI